MKIAAIDAVATTKLAPNPDAKRAGLERASQEFEGVFLRQLLEGSGIGKQAGQGYGPMIVDALASAVGGAGGLGLARSIQRALEPVHAQKIDK